MLKRYRLHEAAERIAEGRGRRLGGDRAELGYFDQAHFVRDFTALIGTSPARTRRGRYSVPKMRSPASPSPGRM